MVGPVIELEKGDVILFQKKELIVIIMNILNLGKLSLPMIYTMQSNLINPFIYGIVLITMKISNRMNIN